MTQYDILTALITKKTQPIENQLRSAERQGFEPWDPQRGSTVFETAPIDHSGISPFLLAKNFKTVCKNTLFFQIQGKKTISFYEHTDYQLRKHHQTTIFCANMLSLLWWLAVKIEYISHVFLLKK